MANRIPRSVTLDYNLPSTVESVQQGWIRSYQASMLISGSLAILASILLTFFKNNQGGALALEILGYASLFLNISACMSSFILIDRLGNMFWSAAVQDEATLPMGKAITTQQNLLKMYGVGSLWRWVVWHWLFCFILGFCSIFAQVLLHVWMDKSTEAKIAATVLATFCSLPLIGFILAPILGFLMDMFFSTNQEDSVTMRSRSVSDVESPRPLSLTMIRQRTPAQSIRTPNSQMHITFPPLKA